MLESGLSRSALRPIAMIVLHDLRWSRVLLAKMATMIQCQLPLPVAAIWVQTKELSRKRAHL